MKMLVLKKQKHNEPRFDELSAMISDLINFLNEDVNPNDILWNKNFNAILDFQDSDGSFKLFDSYEIPGDAMVDFCWMPTYICTAILMKAYLTDPSSFTSKEESALLEGLKMSSRKNLRGHGYDAFKGQIEALEIFMIAGLREFLDIHKDFCTEFSEMISKIITKFDDMETNEEFLGPWGESYEAEIRSINEYFSKRNVFVYGTLMKDGTNHHYLENSTFLGMATIEGYDMYNVGWYPAIIDGNSLIIGELYHVPNTDMPSIDMLEGEGRLYIKRCETVTDSNGNSSFAFIYIYNRDCSDLERISAWNRNYVWYVSYGSNMLKERFMHYIKGGSYGGSRCRQPCSDTAHPLAVRTFEIPYDMYFGNISMSWELGGVSFLDASKKGHALGVAYLITKEQFEHVAAQENGGRYPGGGEWYEDFIDLGEMDGFEVKTITNNNLRRYNNPCRAYLDTLHMGIRQNWPDMSDEEIENYINGCIR